jgi:peptide deformylase
MEILTYPNPALKQISTDVTIFDDVLNKFLDDMQSTMLGAKGLGLAAVQVGVAQKIMLIRELVSGKVVEIINPVIISEEGEQYLEEGCLSFSGIYTKIKRPLQIHFKYVNRTNEPQEGVVFGLEAIEFSHEHDHLLGKTILDHVNRKEKKRILKELGIT